MTIQERLAWLQKEATVLARLTHDGDTNLVEMREALVKLATETHFALTEVRQRLIEIHQAAAE